jgi:hypothetical protein
VYSASLTYFSAKSAYVAFNLEPALNEKLPVNVPTLALEPTEITAALDNVKPVNVPTLVMLGCAAVVTVPAVVALPAEPLTEPEIVADTVKPVNVPTEVMLG